jgi:O-glycosyl hydrolase
MYTTILQLAASVAIPLFASGASVESRQAQQKISVGLGKIYQQIDGFGISGAFQHANLIVNLKQPKQREILDLLFNTSTGAGFSIVRNGGGSTPNSNKDYMSTILLKCPSSPAEVTINYSGYAWDGKDSGQLFLSQRVQDYGVDTFYANAWSAPRCMKTNNQDTNGGQLCGVRNFPPIILSRSLTRCSFPVQTVARETGNKPRQITLSHMSTSTR